MDQLKLGLWSESYQRKVSFNCDGLKFNINILLTNSWMTECRTFWFYQTELELLWSNFQVRLNSNLNGLSFEIMFDPKFYFLFFRPNFPENRILFNHKRSSRDHLEQLWTFLQSRNENQNNRISFFWKCECFSNWKWCQWLQWKLCHGIKISCLVP